MLDITVIRQNRAAVEEKSKQKNVNVDIGRLLELDETRRGLISKIEALRSEKNNLNILDGRPDQSTIEKGSVLKKSISELEEQLSPVNDEYLSILKKVPNLPTSDVPVGKSEEENVVTKEWGIKKDFDFKPLSHAVLAEGRGLIDKNRAARISGSRFAYIKGGLVELQLALMQFVLSAVTNERLLEQIIEDNNLNVVAKPFEAVLPPFMMHTKAYEATGRLKAEEVTYRLSDDDLWLIGSAEHSLVPMYMGEILEEAQLPIRYIGYSTNFRREAGSYGKDIGGIIRMHQFDKLEMEVFSTKETSLDEHFLLIAIQEYLFQKLEIPYRVILKCTADIGDPNARGVDLEAWLPGEGVFKETHSADYMTDYQARDLSTRVRKNTGEVELVHTNDATALAMGRTLAAIIENYQTHDKKIIIPSVLRGYMNNREEI